jgi:glutathione S-transferase
MTIIITAFESSPDRGRGLARDMPVRWALEEVGQPYEVRPLSFAATKQSAHLALNPFGQIPTYEEGDLVLAESGAIVLHIAQTYAGLLPAEAEPRARAVGWMFAALSTLEPPIMERSMAFITEQQQPWYEARLPLLDARIRTRLEALSNRLGDAEWLDGAFSAGDLLVANVLRRLGSSGLLNDYPTVAAYVARAEARPAFQRAFAAQLVAFEASQGA